MFKILNGHTAPNLKEFFRLNNEIGNTYNLRNGIDLALSMPKKEFGRRCFNYIGASLWNNLPQEAKNSESLSSVQNDFETMNSLNLVDQIFLNKVYVCYYSRAARVITGASYDIRSVDVLATLGWQTLDNRRKYLKSIFIYKILNDETAPNLKENFLRISDCPITHQLRNSQTDLVLPFPKSEFKKKTFSYNGATLWNSLPMTAKQYNSMSCFKRLIMSHYLK